MVAGGPAVNRHLLEIDPGYVFHCAGTIGPTLRWNGEIIA
jgi:hypothetical protein